jgi:PBP1b-binding outer membrane lipoprotein LpoB
MSNKLCLILSGLITTTMFLAACAPAAPVQPTFAAGEIATSDQLTTTLAASAAPIQATTALAEIPQSEDLCGGTGGNGQIVSVGNNEFTMKRNDDGRDQVVHLSDQATIRTSAGLVSLSDLKTGYRVTLVGGPNADGSFTADYVVVCKGSE